MKKKELGDNRKIQKLSWELLQSYIKKPSNEGFQLGRLMKSALILFYILQKYVERGKSIYGANN